MVNEEKAGWGPPYVLWQRHSANSGRYPLRLLRLLGEARPQGEGAVLMRMSGWMYLYEIAPMVTLAGSVYQDHPSYFRPW